MSWLVGDGQRANCSRNRGPQGASGKLPKRHWWLGFNGTRMSRNRDAELLEQHQPEIQCMGHPGSVGSQRQSSGKRVTSMFDNPLRRKGFGCPQGGEEAFGLPSCLKRPKGTPRASLSQGEAPCQCSKSQRFQRGGRSQMHLGPLLLAVSASVAQCERPR